MRVIQDALAGGLAALREATGVTVIIRRNGMQSPPTSAAIGPQDFAQNPVDGGVILQADSRTYLIAVTDYILDGQPYEPEKGDVIEETDSGLRGEVRSNNGSRPFEYTDLGHTQYTIHTKTVADG